MLERFSFIEISDLLSEIGRGIGSASKNLVESSATELGTLAVKSADVNVSFELTSAATSRVAGAGVGLPRLGAKTLSLQVAASESGAEERQINKGTITLQIVSVMPPREGDSGRGSQAQEESPPKPDRGGPDEGGAAERNQLLRLIELLRGRLGELHLFIEDRIGIEMELNEVEELVNRGELEAARQRLSHLATEFNRRLESFEAARREKQRILEIVSRARETLKALRLPDAVAGQIARALGAVEEAANAGRLGEAARQLELLASNHPALMR